MISLPTELTLTLPLLPAIALTLTVGGLVVAIARAYERQVAATEQIARSVASQGEAITAQGAEIRSQGSKIEDQAFFLRAMLTALRLLIRGQTEAAQSVLDAVKEPG